MKFLVGSKHCLLQNTQNMQAENAELVTKCKGCGHSGTGYYCSRCGMPYTIKRISMRGLLHDIFHLFTHLDKGFGFTLKKLIREPGTMQREYVEGDRIRHQKPFSMFFICATIAALTRYWIYQVLLKYYQTGNVSEMNFFHEYMVIFHIVLLPVHVVVTYIFFYKSGYNLAEVGVLVLYSVSFLFLFVAVVFLLKFAWPELDTMYIELPILLIYNTITYLNFFRKEPAWLVTVKTVLINFGVFMLIQLMEDFLIRLM
jgi:hypothetical protein